MRGADPVAVGDRGQPLNVCAEHSFESTGLGLTQFRELGSDMRDRTVMLAHLHACASGFGRGSVSLLGQRGGETLSALGNGCAVDRRGDRLLERARTTHRECAHCVVAAAVA